MKYLVITFKQRPLYSENAVIHLSDFDSFSSWQEIIWIFIKFEKSLFVILLLISAKKTLEAWKVFTQSWPCPLALWLHMELDSCPGRPSRQYCRCQWPDLGKWSVLETGLIAMKVLFRMGQISGWVEFYHYNWPFGPRSNKPGVNFVRQKLRGKIHQAEFL